jgi:hypothetical protein
MGMEWKYGSNDFQERFSSDYIRAVCSGLQGGCFPTVLDGITGADNDREKRTWATRTELAALLVRDAGFTCADAFAGFPLIETRPVSQASFATVRRLINRDTFRYLSSLMHASSIHSGLSRKHRSFCRIQKRSGKPAPQICDLIRLSSAHPSAPCQP